MTYTYSTSSTEDAALADKLAAYNAGLETPVTTQEFISRMAVSPFMAGLVEGYVRSQQEAIAADDGLMAVGLKAINATPEKRAAMIAAADAALDAPPSPFK